MIAELAGPDIYLALIVVPIFYFIPCIVAAVRHAQKWPTVLVVNAVAGWTVVGWVVALVVALQSPRTRVRVSDPPSPASTQ